MIRNIYRLALKRVRQYGGLSRKDVAKAIGRKPQVIWRWEEKGQMPSPEQEAILVELAKLTPRAFLVIMCDVLSDLGKVLQVKITPADGIESLRGPLARSTGLYHAAYSELDAGERARIEERLLQGRMLDSLAEQILRMFEKDVGRQIQAALAAKRERLVRSRD